MLGLSLNSIKTNDEEIHEEYQYLKLIKHIVAKGTMENGRNGNALTVFGGAMHFDLNDGKIPLLTTKKLPGKLV